MTVTQLDMTDKAAVVIRLSSGMRVLMGDTNGLATRMDALAGVLPTVWEKHGEDAAGTLDMTSYGDEDDTNDQAQYTL